MYIRVSWGFLLSKKSLFDIYSTKQQLDPYIAKVKKQENNSLNIPVTLSAIKIFIQTSSLTLPALIMNR